jgi:hypothetical protein
MTESKDFIGTKFKGLVFLSFAVFLCLAVGRAFTNMPLGDEANLCGPAVSLSSNGFMGDTISGVQGTPLESQIYKTYWYPPLGFISLALVYKILGIGLFPARFLSVFWGLSGLTAIYYLAREFFKDNKKAVVFLLFLIATDYFYIYSSSHSRMDMMSASLFFMGVAVYFFWRRKNLNIAVFLSALSICLSGLIHVNGIVLGLPILLFLILYQDIKNIRTKTLFLFLLPYILGALGWGMYIIKDAGAFRIQSFNEVFQIERPDFINGIKWATVYYEMLTRYLENYGLSFKNSSFLEFFKFPVLLFFILNFLAAPFILKKKSRMIWYMLALCFLILMFVIPNKTGCYLCWITPLFILNSVAVWTQVDKNRLLRGIYMAFFVYIILVSLGGSAYCIKRNQYLNIYLSDLNEFDRKHYTDGSIYGPRELAFFYGFDSMVLHDVTMGFFSGVKPGYFVIESEYRKVFAALEKGQTIEHFVSEEMLSLLEEKHKDFLDAFKEKGGVKTFRDYIDHTLTEEYRLVFKGKYYTFYKRKNGGQP